MLISFVVENYKSIKDEITLDMIRSDGNVSAVTNNNINYFEQTINGEVFPICPIMAIFGPNASGKSNILKALITMRQLVLNGDSSIYYDPFSFSDESTSKPTKFKIVFSKNNIVYEYVIIFDAKEIKQEYLNKQENGKDSCVFDTDVINTIPKDAWSIFVCRHKTMLLCLTQILPDDTDIKNVVDFFKKDIVVADDINLLPVVGRDIKSKIKTVKNILMNMDMGFCDIDVGCLGQLRFRSGEIINKEDIDNKIKILKKKYKGCLVSFNRRNDDETKILHDEYEVYDINMIYKKDAGSSVKMNLMKDESTGTRNLFRFVLFLIDALKNGKIIAFDEIDRTIHTELIRYIFNMVKAANLNIKNTQLICSSHNPCAMLDLDSREIFIVNKNQSLSTYGKYLVEYDLNEKTGIEILDMYLRGHVGGIPKVVDVFEEMGV